MSHLNSDFLWFEKDNVAKLFVRNNNIWMEVSLSDKPFESFINGDPEITFEGIRLNICKDISKSFILTDSFGSVPCYSFFEFGVSAITTSPFRLFEELGFTLEYDLEKMLDYFILSYHGLDNKTLYKGLNFVTPGAKIGLRDIEKKQIFRTIFQPTNSNITPSDLAKELLEIAKIKLNGIDSNKLVLLLTGGQDSLIGALLLKLTIGDVDCATFGFKNSVDLEWSEHRHKMLFPNSKHFTFNIEEFQINSSNDETYSCSLGGFGPYTSIYYESFFDKLKTLGKEYFIFSDHFEAIRKKIKNSDYFVENYTTPKEVVNRYFTNLDLYNEHLTKIELEIFSKFSVDPFYEFYFFDRNSRGMFYKNVLARKHGKAKITLINNAEFLNRNFNFIRQTGQFPYDGILDYLLNELQIKDRNWLFPPLNNSKPIPIQPLNDLKRVRTHFLEMLKKENSNFLESLFKRDELVKALTTMEMGANDPWLLLRIYQILVARNYEKNTNM